MSPVETPINASEVRNATGGSWETPSVVIEQGTRGWVGIHSDQVPVWLLRLLFDTPNWFRLAAYGVMLAFLVHAVWWYYKRGVSREIIIEKAYQTTFLLTVGFSTVALIEGAEFPFTVSVVGAVVVGAVVDRWARSREVYDIPQRGDTTDA